MLYGLRMISVTILFLLLGGVVLTAQEIDESFVGMETAFCAPCAPEDQWQGTAPVNLSDLDPDQDYWLQTNPFCCNITETMVDNTGIDTVLLSPSEADMTVTVQAFKIDGDAGAFIIRLYEDDGNGIFDANDMFLDAVWGFADL